jgi:hypothetical protein
MAKTQTTQPPVPAPPAEPQSTMKDYLGLGQISNPTVQPEGLLPEDLFSRVFGDTRRYMRLSSTGEGDADTWVERMPARQNNFYTFDRTPMPLNSWAAAAFHSSPYRPAIFWSPCVFSQASMSSPLEDMYVVWATYDIVLDRSNPKRMLPSIDLRSRAAVRQTISELKVQPWLVIDAGVSQTALWRLSSGANWDYCALLTEKIARATGARLLPMPSGGIRTAVSSMLAARNMNSASLAVAQDAERDRRKTAMTNVLIPLPGQVAPVLPRHVVSATFLGEKTAAVKVEDLARAYMLPRED